MFLKNSLVHAQNILDEIRAIYFNSPGLSQGAILKMTGIELELISDIKMHVMIERGMRGGISYISKRFSKANNKYMKNYDSSKVNSLSIQMQTIYMVGQ